MRGTDLEYTDAFRLSSLSRRRGSYDMNCSTEAALLLDEELV
jgi:hypothetical protein